ncbi:hypothetical protein [Methanoculleus caldifontis]|uniref:hypothetical protein n=1 Tax=Methanoculleus caldifontis TaxID=2651577 RepID=UPI002936E074|nr:hypothetical protein [Methanoculleus sp. Wushi-C6]
MVAVTLAIIYLLPRLTKAVPSSLVAIIVVTAAAIAAKADVLTVGDLGEITRALPLFHLLAVPLTVETLVIVGLLESLLTASIVDEMTDTRAIRTGRSEGRGLRTASPGSSAGWPAAR